MIKIYCDGVYIDQNYYAGIMRKGQLYSKAFRLGATLCEEYVLTLDAEAIRHQDVFGAVGSTSGGLDIRPFPDNWNMKAYIGNRDENLEVWNNHTVINQLDRLKNGSLAIIIDCGVGDFFLAVNKAVHERLLSQKIDHDFILRPGGHNHEYWNNSIGYQIKFFKKFFDKK